MATHYPHPAHHFSVQAGFARIGFTRVQLPRVERDLIRYREGSDPVETVRLLPGLERLTDCVLERGVVPPDNEFFAWLGTAHVGAVQRRDVVVKLLNQNHEPVMTWLLRNCFPIALEWSPLDAQHSLVLVETLRLAVEAMDVTTAA
jgi:phage tail-like protein